MQSLKKCLDASFQESIFCKWRLPGYVLKSENQNLYGKEVYAGPVEGTALGNLMVQMLKDGSFKTLEEARECVASSFDVKK